jgi:hypothetical protein
MFLIGIPAEVVVTVGSINLIYQFWVHTEHVGKLGWYEWVFVTPSNHRVHHAQNERYLDRNYGGLFILWDRLFGTFQEELEEDPPIYGIRGALHSWNPLRALTHIYVDMFRDSWNTRHWRDKLYVWIARTGWRPDDVAADDPRPKSDLAAFTRFDPQVSGSVRAYALFQLLAVVALLGYMQQAFSGGYLVGLGLAIAMLLTTVTTAFWLEGAEFSRCLGLDAARVLLLGSGLAGIAALEGTSGEAFLTTCSVYLVVNVIFVIHLARAEARPEAPQERLPAL